MILNDLTIIRFFISHAEPGASSSESLSQRASDLAADRFVKQDLSLREHARIQDLRWKGVVFELGMTGPARFDIRKVSSVFLSRCSEQEIRTILQLDEWGKNGKGDPNDKKKAVSKIVKMIQSRANSLDLSSLARRFTGIYIVQITNSGLFS